MKLLFYFLFISNIILSQSISDLKTRFDTYLNFNGSLNQSVSFTEKSVSIKSAGKSDFTIYDGEQEILTALLKTKKPSEFTTIYNWKKNNRLSKKQIDSLTKTISQVTYISSTSLQGKRIAIDPGHFAGNMTDARVEQKFIDFSPSASNLLKDTIRFNEGTLTYQTAIILKHKLEEEGAIVMVTRPQQNYTSFQITYDTWFMKRKKIILDSLVKANSMDTKRYSALMKLSKQKLFWEFFRDFELGERARLINEFKPDASIIIHYNVDEKNTL
jgi:N-acetylmuramoyl-L-alanine amidase